MPTTWAKQWSPGCTHRTPARRCFDVELGIPFGGGAELAIGAENLLNAYPDVNPFGPRTVGNAYGQFSPFGFNGAYYYTRISYGWGG